MLPRTPLRKQDFPGGTVVKNHLPMQGTQVRALVPEDPTCRKATKPMSHNYWSPCASCPRSATREATAMRSLHTATKSSPCSPQLRKPAHSNKDPMQTKNKYINKFIFLKKKVKRQFTGNSLAVQWLRPGAFTEEGPGLIPGQGTKIPQATWRGQNNKKNKNKKIKTIHRMGDNICKSCI